MSRLAVGNDDHPEAARKHLADAYVLNASARHDGAAYHAGYVVECTLKAVLLHDRAHDTITGAPDPVKLQQWHNDLRKKPYGHKLAGLLGAGVGPQGARYWPELEATDSVVRDWTETARYWRPGAVTEAKARAFLAWADLTALAVVQMTLDGVA